jgi:hypothetical protein
MSAPIKRQLPPGVPFIPAVLDDASLTAPQFRLLCRIARRGRCTESVSNMAAACQMNQETAWLALAALLELRMVRRISRPGFTSIHEATPAAEWKLPTRKQGAPPKTEWGHSEIGGGYPLGNRGHEGTPLEGTPSKVRKNGSGRFVSSNSTVL